MKEELQEEDAVQVCIVSERGRRAQRDGSHRSQCRHWDLT